MRDQLGWQQPVEILANGSTLPRRRRLRGRGQGPGGSWCSAGWSPHKRVDLVVRAVARLGDRAARACGWTSSARARSSERLDGAGGASSASPTGSPCTAGCPRRRRQRCCAGPRSTSAPRTSRAGARWSSRPRGTASRPSPATCRGSATRSRRQHRVAGARRCRPRRGRGADHRAGPQRSPRAGGAGEPHAHRQGLPHLGHRLQLAPHHEQARAIVVEELGRVRAGHNPLER